MLSIDTTNNLSPNQALNPSPVNNGIGISTSTTLSWECTDPNSDSLIYDIYLWSTGSSFSKIATGVTTTTYNFSSALLPATIYYWFITAKDEHNSVSVGSIWTFTTS